MTGAAVGPALETTMPPPPPRPVKQPSQQQALRDDFGFTVPKPYSSLYRGTCWTRPTDRPTDRPTQSRTSRTSSRSLSFCLFHADFRSVLAIEEAHRLDAWERWLEPHAGSVARALAYARGEQHQEEDERDACEPSASSSASSRAASVAVARQELAVLVKAGVPRAYRKEVWKALLVRDDYGGTSAGGDAAATYAALVSQIDAAEFRDDLDQIEKDLHRTFPNHRLTGDEEGKARLRRILGAYAVRNPLVGYCQGLNFLAATFLLVFCPDVGDDESTADVGDDESTAFWCFVALVEDILTGYFDPMMINQQVDGLVFEQLVRELLPGLAAHFDEVGVHVPTAVAGWFLVAFVNSLPAEATMRVWDVLFLDSLLGQTWSSPAALFRVALALLEIYKEAILECRNDSDAYMLVQAIGSITFDASSLVEAMGGFTHVTGSVLVVMRGKYAPGIAKVMEKMFVSSAGGGNGRGIGSGLGVSSAPAAWGSSSGGVDRNQNSTNAAIVENALSTDIEKRLGILRLRHKDPAQALVMDGGGGGGGTNPRSTGGQLQDSLRRTQSALNDSTPGIVLHGRNERLKQQLRINLLAMRTFVPPDMKLLKTALRIASGNLDAANPNANATGDENEDATPADGNHAVAADDSALVPRRFTDGGALLASPFKQQARTTTATSGVPGPSYTPTPTLTPNPNLSLNVLPLEKLRNIEAIKSALTVELSHSVSLLEQISSANLDLSTTVAEVSDQLSKVQQEIEHKVSTYEALFNRANQLQDESKAVEITYRKQLTTNIKLADSWRAISKDIKKNDTTLKSLMELAESKNRSAAPHDNHEAHAASPTKRFTSRVKSMVGRKFTR